MAKKSPKTPKNLKIPKEVEGDEEIVIGRSPIAKKLLPNGISAVGIKLANGKPGVQLYVGMKFTGGDAFRRKFATVKAAKDWAFGPEAASKSAQTTGLVSLVKRAGHAVFEMTADQVREAVWAFKRLSEVKLSLSEAVNLAILHARPPKGATTIAAAIEAMQKVKRAALRDKKYVDGLGYLLGAFAEDFETATGKTAVHEVAREQIEDWLEEEEFERATKRNYMKALQMFYTFCIDRGWTSINPMTGIPMPDTVKPEVIPIKPDQLEKLLKVTVAAADDVMAIGLAIKAFAGVRTSELLKLDWAQVNRTQLRILAKNSKTRNERVIDLEPNMIKWINTYRKKAGLVVGLSPRGWHDRVIALASQSEVELTQNVLRKSFCSYHLAQGKNENFTAVFAGNSPAMILANYRGVIDDPEEIKAYWAILPPASLPVPPPEAPTEEAEVAPLGG